MLTEGLALDTLLEAPVEAEVVKVDRPEPETEAVMGPLQCQWSPWGSQPYDSVGLGFRLTVPDVLVCSSWSWSSSSSWWVAEEVAEAEVTRGPSQCLRHGSVSA